MKMMKKAGFTLVELIVVITILAILGTIAFISLQGNTQDAKNSKVLADLRTLASAIEIAVTKGPSDGGATLDQINGTTDLTGTNGVTGNAFSGALALTTTASANYEVSDIAFNALRQNGDDFKDPNGDNYVYAFASNSGEAMYQIAGQVSEADGTNTIYIKGNYVDISAAETEDGLISTSAAATPISNGDNGADGVVDLY